MPEATKEEGKEKIKGYPPRRAKRATKRKVDVISKPFREAHMPPLPECSEVGSRIGTIEVSWKSNSKKQGKAASKVSIATEIAIELHCIAEHRAPKCGRRVLQRSFKSSCCSILK